MTNLPSSVSNGVLLGDQTPRIRHVPYSEFTSGPEAIELANDSGLILDPWQELVINDILQEDEDGLWTSMECGLCVPRQNGKGAIIEARELAGLFLFGERLIIHSAHEFPTALEAFQRLLQLIESNPDLDDQVDKVSNSHGEEGITLKKPKSYDGMPPAEAQRIRFKARTKGGGRGFTGDLLVLDEAMVVSAAMIGAQMPTISARPNPQILYFGSAVDEDIHEHGQVFSDIRDRGLEGEDPSLCYHEFSNEEGADPSDPRTWARSNPGMGYRVSERYLRAEYRSIGRTQPRTHEVERLGIGRWPIRKIDSTLVEESDWTDLINALPSLKGDKVIGVDMTPDNKWITIVACQLTADGKVHGEVGYHARPNKNAVKFLLAVIERWDPIALVLDRTGPISSIVPDLIAAGIEPVSTTAAQMGAACGGFIADIEEGDLGHTGDPLLLAAIRGLEKRPIGKVFGFAAKPGTVISPVVAFSLARWGLLTLGNKKKKRPANRAVSGAASTRRTASSSNLLQQGF